MKLSENSQSPGQDTQFLKEKVCMVVGWIQLAHDTLQ
jgi:hypothetical protein